MVELNNPTVSDNTENGAHNMVKLTIDNCEVVVSEHTRSWMQPSPSASRFPPCAICAI